MFKLDWKSTLIICSFLALGFYWLISLVRAGEPVGWVILGLAGVMVVLFTLVSSVVIIIRTIKDHEQTTFINNARENLAIMKQMQALQNTQTTIVARRNVQLEQQLARQLPAPENQTEAIIFDAEIFEDLDDIDEI